MEIYPHIIKCITPAAIIAAVTACITLPAMGEQQIVVAPSGAPLDESGAAPAAAGLPPGTPSGQTPRVVHPVNKEKELMITDLKVVESSRATLKDANTPDDKVPWHIRTLFKNLNGGNEPSKIIIEWLAEWEKDSVVNGFPLPARPNITSQVIQPWLEASNMTRPSPEGDWANFKLDWTKAPFRLLAIVNRIDLADDPKLGAVTSAGEGRFVFGVLSPEGDPLPFTIIFEYKLPATDQESFNDWAHAWHALGTHPRFNENYLKALQKVTGAFAGSNPILNQLRTNEIALGAPWELREFHLKNGKLLPAPVKQNPDLSFNLRNSKDPVDSNDPDGKDSAKKSAMLSRFIAEGPALLPDALPEKYTGGASEPFLAASALNPFPNRPIWTARNIQSERIHTFALNTCNGCHGVEGGMVPREFTMVQVRDAGEPSKLAGFLTGKAPSGQENSGSTTFSDPRETWRRMTFKNDLEARARILQLLTEPEVLTDFPAAPGDVNVPEESLLGRSGRVH